MKRKGKIRWGAVLNAVVGVSAILADESVLGLLPHAWSVPIAIGCKIIGALQKPAYERAP